MNCASAKKQAKIWPASCSQKILPLLGGALCSGGMLWCCMLCCAAMCFPLPLPFYVLEESLYHHVATSFFLRSTFSSAISCNFFPSFSICCSYLFCGYAFNIITFSIMMKNPCAITFVLCVCSRFFLYLPLSFL